MRNFIIGVITFAVVASGCSKKEPLDNFTEKEGHRIEILRAIFPENGPITRLIKESSESDRIWESVDDIAVHVNKADGSDPQYIYGMWLGGDNFQVDLYEGYTRDFYTIYPFDWAVSDNHVTPLKVNLPSEYYHDNIKDNKFTVGAYAKNESGNNTLDFSYICGCLRLKITGVPSGTSKLTVLLDKCITGTFDVAVTGRNRGIFVNSTDTPEAVTIFLEDNTDAEVYIVNIPLPRGTYATVNASAFDASNAEGASGSAQFTETVIAGGLYEFTLDLSAASSSPIGGVTTTPMPVVVVGGDDYNHIWN